MWGYVYFLVNNSNNILYIWVTNNLVRRIYEHKNKIIQWFTSKYNIYKLVYYEKFTSILEAIQREKYFKWLKREKKNIYIENMNPRWEEIIL